MHWICLPGIHLPNWEPVMCWHFLGDSRPNQHVTGSWCLPLVLHIHCWTCLMPHSKRQVLAGWGKVLECMCSFSESRCCPRSFSFLHAHIHANVCVCTPGEFPRGSMLSAVYYQPKNSEGQIFSFKSLQHQRFKVLRLYFTLTFMHFCGFFVEAGGYCFCIVKPRA